MALSYGLAPGLQGTARGVQAHGDVVGNSLNQPVCFGGVEAEARAGGSSAEIYRGQEGWGKAPRIPPQKGFHHVQGCLQEGGGELAEGTLQSVARQ